MLILYLLFFSGVNFLIYNLLTKDIKLNTRLIICVAILLIIFLSIQFFYLHREFVSNTYFNGLMQLSLGIIIIHFVIKFIVSLILRDFEKMGNNYSFIKDFLINFFDFFRYKLVYVLVFIYQGYSLFSWYHEYSNQ